MTTNSSLALLLMVVLATTIITSTTDAYAYSTATPYFGTVRSSMTMKRGRGSFQKEAGMTGGTGSGSNSSPGGGLGSSSSNSNINWCPLPPGNKLPTEDNAVTLMDTNLTTLKNRGTNPTGAVAVVKYDGQTYCFASSCPSCKIPLVKAKVYPAAADADSKAPRLACDFCKSAYNLKTGAKEASIQEGGFFGSIVKSVMSAQASGPLPVYKLGEKNGKMLIAVD
jgi:nitrite reductase/ring-hydroxylating ferredoxin subunit